MIQPEAQEKKKGAPGGLPKISKVSQLVLIIAAFLVILIPLILVNQQQKSKEDQVKANLTNLRRIATAEQGETKEKYESELAQLTADMEEAKAAFPRSSQAPEIMDSLLELAERNDINVTQTKVASSRPEATIGPVLTFTLGLKGQIPKFQNFLLALDNSLPTSRITQFTFTVGTAKEAQDTASVTIQVFCYDGT